MNDVIVAGDAALDVVARHRGLVAGGDRKATVRTVFGGAGANTAAWLAHLGARPVLVGRVGDDPAGRQVTEDLTRAGVRCALTVDPGAPTCCVVVLVDERGGRTMLSDRGAAALSQPDDLPTGLLTIARHLHLSGYALADDSSRPAALAMLAAARDAGLTTSVDPAVAARLADFPAWVSGIDLLLPNTDELAALTGSREATSAQGLLDVAGAVAVTDGAAGAAWIDRDGVLAAAAGSVECVDSTGAGDAFDAGVIAAWLAGKNRAEMLRAGVDAGTEAVRHVGARPVTSR